MRFPWHLALDWGFIGQFLAYFYGSIALHCAPKTVTTKHIWERAMPWNGSFDDRTLHLWRQPAESAGLMAAVLWAGSIALRTKLPYKNTYMGACNAMEWFFWWQDLFNQRFGLREGEFHWNCWKNEKFLKNDPFLAKLSENPKPYTTGFSRFPG